MNPLNKIELNNNKNGNSKINYYPIVYRDDYDIRVGFFSKLHPFDTYKWSKIADSISKSLDCKVNYKSQNYFFHLFFNNSRFDMLILKNRFRMNSFV